MPATRDRIKIPRRSTGVTLIEFLLALLIWGIALANLLPPVWRAVRNSYTLGEAVQTRKLAEEIQEEFAALPRKSGDEDSGAASGSAIPDTMRVSFTSPFQYDELEECPPKDPLGNDLQGAAHFTRKVLVESVDPESLDTVEDETSDLVRVRVEIFRKDVSVDSLVFLRSLR